MRPASTGVAKREKSSQPALAGRLVQAVGLAAPFLLYWGGATFVGPLTGLIGGVTGVFFLLILLVVGARMATTWRCGHCGSPLASKGVELCPSCRATFK